MFTSDKADCYFNRIMLRLAINPKRNDGIGGRPVDQLEPAKHPFEFGGVIRMAGFSFLKIDCYRFPNFSMRRSGPSFQQFLNF